MDQNGVFVRRRLTVFVCAVLAGVTAQTWAADDTSQTATDDSAHSSSTTQLDTVHVTAEKVLKQQPGVSVITAKDINKDPPVNDASDIIRKMPGVNLTGNSNTGARGNNRQIDIRGMGPENTLIMIDGIPATSRNSVRYDRTGERDTRGDTNWVPAEEIERIEVLRGPAAAIYGSGAMGGVVNIITKHPSKKWKGSFDLYTNQPGRDKEGATKRAGFDLSGPLKNDDFTMRIYGNINKTDADDPDINSGAVTSAKTTAAGREGVRNKDVNMMLSWRVDPAQKLDMKLGFSRQGNIYAGDTSLSLASTNTAALAAEGAETNRMYKEDFALIHSGTWDWGNTQSSISYTNTRNSRMDEGLTGKVDGQITTADSFSTSHLDDYRGTTKADIPVDLWVPQTLTTGLEWTYSALDDPFSTSYAGGCTSSYYTTCSSSTTNTYTGSTDISSSDRSSTSSEHDLGVYLEDNIEVTDSTKVVPGVRLDHHSEFGSNWTPSLNISQDLGSMFTVKAGIARAFKAPNLYQSDPNYLLVSSGNGCPIGTSASCYLVGNDDLKPERSVNSELGLEFKNEGWVAGLTYFENDYKNKIVAGTDLLGTYAGYNVYQWVNTGKALVRGWEGNVTVPVSTDISWTTNGTYMVENKDYETGNPLSIVPKYTINTMLDWKVNDKWSVNTNYTFYGRQKPRTNATNRNDVSSGVDTTAVGAYGLLGVGTQYQVTKNVQIGTGVSNIFDKVIYRSTNGANTYNQPGVAYYAKLHVTF
jgi:ferric enterobactin receptor